MLEGDGAGNFNPLPLQQSGIFLPGDAKALVSLIAGKKVAVAASQNRGPLQLFTRPAPGPILRFDNDDASTIVYLKSGKKRKQELMYGSSFLSQAARYLALDTTMHQVEIIKTKGQLRKITL